MSPPTQSDTVEPINVPVIDFQDLYSANPTQRRAAVEQLDQAFQETGFAHIRNHTISSERILEALEWSRKFFKQPVEVKDKVARPLGGGIDEHVGWARVGVGNAVQMVFDAQEVEERQKLESDFKETLEICNPFCEDIAPNRWLPEEDLPGFRKFVESWWEDCAGLMQGLLHSLGEALQVSDPDHLGNIHTKHDICHMTWNYYPRMPITKDAGARLKAHTDFGTMILVFQDTIGGLEVHDGNQFRPIVPVPGAVVVNVGDMLEQQSNGRWRSALHRVVATSKIQDEAQQSDSAWAAERYSLVFFGNPSPEELIETLPGCEKPGKWTPNMVGDWGQVSARQWIEKRLAVEYN